VPPERITADEPLEALGIDSLGMAEMLFFMEDEFKLELPYEPVSLVTLGDATRYLDGLLAARKLAEAAPGAEAATQIRPDRHA
jgi:acyl carrier protein